MIELKYRAIEFLNGLKIKNFHLIHNHQLLTKNDLNVWMRRMKVGDRTIYVKLSYKFMDKFIKKYNLDEYIIKRHTIYENRTQKTYGDYKVFKNQEAYDELMAHILKRAGINRDTFDFGEVVGVDKHGIRKLR